MPRPKRRPEQELRVEAADLAAIIFQCSNCGGRIEIEADGGMKDGAACPCCGASLAEERRLFLLYAALYRELRHAPEPARFRVTLRA